MESGGLESEPGDCLPFAGMKAESIAPNSSIPGMEGRRENHTLQDSEVRKRDRIAGRGRETGRPDPTWGSGGGWGGGWPEGDSAFSGQAQRVKEFLLVRTLLDAIPSRKHKWKRKGGKVVVAVCVCVCVEARRGAKAVVLLLFVISHLEGYVTLHCRCPGCAERSLSSPAGARALWTGGLQACPSPESAPLPHTLTLYGGRSFPPGHSCRGRRALGAGPGSPSPSGESGEYQSWKGPVRSFGPKFSFGK